MLQLVVKEFATCEEFLSFTPEFPVSFKWYDGTMDTIKSQEEWGVLKSAVMHEGAIAPISAHVPHSAEKEEV